MEHGMNCPHHADKDEACTCALTERTMHAAWRKRAEEAETRIAALEAQVKALTEERDAALHLASVRGDAMEDIAGENNEQADQLNKIIDNHGGWDDSIDTYAGHFERIINRLTADRDAQAEAVRVLGEAVYETAWQVTDEGCDVLHNVSPAVMTNPIARAAVEGGKRED